MISGHFVPADLCEDLICCIICYEPFASVRTPKVIFNMLHLLQIFVTYRQIRVPDFEYTASNMNAL